MNNKELIQAWRDNDKQFIQRTVELINEARRIGIENFVYAAWREKDGTVLEWGECTKDDKFIWSITYRLRPDYEEEAEEKEWEDALLDPSTAIRELQEFCDALYVAVTKLRDGRTK